jgi:hypothetical protein
VRPRLPGGGSRRGACRSDLSCLPVEGPRPSFKRSDEFIGWDDFDEDAAHEAGLKPRLGIEELTAECMADQGLEYTPFIPPGGFSPDQEAGWELTDNESRLRHGYGFFAMILAGYQVQRGARGGTGRGELKRGGALRAI